MKCEEVYILKVLLNGEYYYLADFKNSLTLNKGSAIIFADKATADNYSATVEKIYETKGILATAFVEGIETKSLISK